jgi:hypothetical protein
LVRHPRQHVGWQRSHPTMKRPGRQDRHGALLNLSTGPFLIQYRWALRNAKYTTQNGDFFEAVDFF